MGELSGTKFLNIFYPLPKTILDVSLKKTQAIEPEPESEIGLSEKEMLLIKNRNNLEPVVYSRRKNSERSKNHIIIPAHGQPKALVDNPSNIPGNPTLQPDLTSNSAPKPILELETGTFEADDLPIAVGKELADVLNILLLNTSLTITCLKPT